MLEVLAKKTDYVVFDVETTGLSPRDGDRIIEIAAIRLQNMTVVDQFESFVNPGRDIPEQAQRVNHITADMVMSAPVFREIFPQFIDFVGGACLCGQNVKFDLDFVCCESSLAGYKLRDETPAIDTLKMAKYFMPQLGSFRLARLAQAFGIRAEASHRALADVQVTTAVFRHLLGLAEDQGMYSFQDIVKEFGVAKPVYRLEQNQGSLF